MTELQILDLISPASPDAIIQGEDEGVLAAIWVLDRYRTRELFFMSKVVDCKSPSIILFANKSFVEILFRVKE